MLLRLVVLMELLQVPTQVVTVLSPWVVHLDLLLVHQPAEPERLLLVWVPVQLVQTPLHLVVAQQPVNLQILSLSELVLPPRQIIKFVSGPRQKMSLSQAL